MILGRFEMIMECLWGDCGMIVRIWDDCGMIVGCLWDDLR